MFRAHALRGIGPSFRACSKICAFQIASAVSETWQTWCFDSCSARRANQRLDSGGVCTPVMRAWRASCTPGRHAGPRSHPSKRRALGCVVTHGSGSRANLQWRFRTRRILAPRDARLLAWHRRCLGLGVPLDLRLHRPSSCRTGRAGGGRKLSLAALPSPRARLRHPERWV